MGAILQRIALCCGGLALTAVAGVVAACSSESSPAPRPPPEQHASEPADPQIQRFDGVTVQVLTFTGPQVAEALQRRGPEFTRRTGATIEITLVPFSELYRTALDDFTSGTASHDVVVFGSQWLGDFAEPGHIEDLSARVAATPILQWDDIAPFFRNVSAMYEGRIHAVPLDGDFQMVYYRSDLLASAALEPPRTWDDYLRIAKTFHGRDLNGDGVADYGSCISKRPGAQAYWMIWSVASSFLQSRGTSQGAFFDTGTMQPLIANEGFAAALDVYKTSGSYGPASERELDVADTRRLFTAGRCALSLDWGDIGTLAIAADSRVADKVGAVILPGSAQVLDRATGKLVRCEKATCPYAIDSINHAPYAAFGGWAGALNADSPAGVKDAAFAFLAYMGQPEQANQDVTIGATGFNPYRKSQFANRQAWLDVGMSEPAAARYLGAIGVSLSSPNMVLDLRIPHNQRYQQVALDRAIADFLAGTKSREQTMQELAHEWNQITEELGRQSQLDAYRSSLGLVR